MSSPERSAPPGMQDRKAALAKALAIHPKDVHEHHFGATYSRCFRCKDGGTWRVYEVFTTTEVDQLLEKHLPQRLKSLLEANPLRECIDLQRLTEDQRRNQRHSIALGEGFVFETRISLDGVEYEIGCSQCLSDQMLERLVRDPEAFRDADEP